MNTLIPHEFFIIIHYIIVNSFRLKPKGKSRKLLLKNLILTYTIMVSVNTNFIKLPYLH